MKSATIMLTIVMAASLGFSHTHTLPCSTDRMAAFHQTLVATDEVRPNSSVDTYLNDKYTHTNTYKLAKIVPFVKDGDRAVYVDHAEHVTVLPKPGAVTGSFDLHGVSIRTEITPLAIGRDEQAWMGVALYQIESDGPVYVKCGGGDQVYAFDDQRRCIRLHNNAVGRDDHKVQERQGYYQLAAKNHPLSVAINSSGTSRIVDGDDGGEILEIAFEAGKNWILVAFSEDADNLATLIDVDPETEKQKIQEHYEQLLAIRIDTPVETLNDAFKHALITLEYTWLPPWGWMECIHHWVSMWHMHASGAAAWLGQADRARSCTVEHADLMPDGAAPQLAPGGHVHRDFGGSNQYFNWQLQNYLEFTADPEVYAKMGPIMDRVIESTFREYDHNFNSLLGWGLQVGNQEDFIVTPYDGTTPSIEGIQMLRNRADIARATGDDALAEKLLARVDRMIDLIGSTLWMPDLGRFAYYVDPTGTVALDGQYHTQIYPVIYGLTDPLDSYTTMRHIRDRLSNEDGGVYASNNFPIHANGTWGMQAGAAQQPWAAWGFSAAGFRNNTYRPLKWISEFVMNDHHRGAWPEVAAETVPAYFSPPAGLYLQATIEALFGLNKDGRNNTLTISPSFPDDWEQASLALPEFTAEFSRRGNVLRYDITNEETLAYKLRWMIEPAHVDRVRINGRRARFEVEPGVNCVVVSADAPAGNNITIEIRLRPQSHAVEYPKSVAQGDDFQVDLSGARIVEVADRAGLFDRFRVDGDGLKATLSDNLVDDYLAYGRLGQLNFSQRTAFVLLETRRGVQYWKPLDVVVLPRWEVAPVKPVQGSMLHFTLRNNQHADVNGNGFVQFKCQSVAFDAGVKARSEKDIAIALPASDTLKPGQNNAFVMLPDGDTVELTFIADIPIVPDTLRHVDLPETLLKPDSEWNNWQQFYGAPHAPWGLASPPLSGLDDPLIEIDEIEGLTFKLNPGHLIPVSYRAGSRDVQIPLPDQPISKVYVLLLPLLDNHTMFMPAAEFILHVDEVHTGITLQRGISTLNKRLYMPGDLDWFTGPPEYSAGFYTTRDGAPENRFGLLDLLSPACADWADGTPPAFPQPIYWSRNLNVMTPVATYNVIELQMPEPLKLKSLAVRALSMDAAVAVAAISVQ